MEKYFENKNIIGLLFKWKIHLIIITVIAAICAMIFSSPIFITPLFKSFAVVYPSNTNPYSEESETEQMLQLLQSRDIKDSVIIKFDLAKHYEIDPNYKYFYTTLLYEFDQRVSIRKTMYESVEIEVFDKNPDTACLIINAILHFYDMKVSKMHREKWLEVVKIYEDQLTRKGQFIDSLKSVLHMLGVDYGLYEYESQSEEITKGLLKTINSSGASQINTKEVNKLNDAMEQKAGELISIVELIRNEARTFADVKLEYEQATRFYTSKLTYSNLVSPPYPADKKSYPTRWLIVLITIIAVFFFASILVILLENYKSYLGINPSGNKQKSETEQS